MKRSTGLKIVGFVASACALASALMAGVDQLLFAALFISATIYSCAAAILQEMEAGRAALDKERKT
jgi:hypothetical protein